jgi:CP family cyanate transporter-like MFS transporter
VTRSRAFLLAAVVATGLCLRPPITGVSPLLDQIGDDLDLSAAWLGALTTLPVLCFGLAALATPRWMRRFGAARVLAACLCLLAVAEATRVLGDVFPLFAGTLAVGVAIGIANTALPALIKRWFPDRIPFATSIYTLSLVGGAAIAAGIVIPLQDALGSGWETPLALLTVPVVGTAAVWIWISRTVPDGRDEVGAGTLWRDRLAWNVTGFMGLQALVAYAIMVWLPTIAIDRGLSASEGGALLALAMTVQGAGALCTPLLIRNTRDQQPALILTILLTSTGVIGVVFAPIELVWLSTVVLSTGQGVSFALAITLIGLRSADPYAAGELSGMTQSVGYVIAALGPFAFGALHTLSGGWTVPALSLLVCCAAMLAVGLPAARSGFVAVSSRGG